MISDVMRIAVNKKLTNEFSALIGNTVTSVSAVSDRELKRLGLEHFSETTDPTVCIAFKSGHCLILSSDPEGNGPGFGILAEPIKKKQA